MNRKVNLTIISAIALIIGTAFVIKDSTGKASYSGAPGDFGTCGSCHGGGAGATTVSISTTPALDPGNTYTPGVTYTINVLVNNSNFSKFGFDATILNGTTGSSAYTGTMSAPGAGVYILNGTAGRKYATHQSPKTGTGSALFTFAWTAPLTGTASVVYACGNAVNGTGGTGGDAVGTGSLLMTPLSAAGLKVNTGVLNSLAVYPNPASETINITYSLNDTKDVLIELYNINGSKAAVLVNEKQSPGFQSKSVQLPTDLSSGVYFLRATVDGSKVSQRLLSIN